MSEYVAEVERVPARSMSASQVKTHRNCPMAYWFKYVAGVEPSKPESKYLKFGSAVHDAIEAVLTSETLMSVERFPSKENVREAVLNEYDRFEAEYDVPEEMADDAETCADSVGVYLSGRPTDGIRAVEDHARFEVSRPDFSAEFTGFMDVTTTDGEIWDWKTGSIRDDTGDEEKIQGMVYAGAYASEYDEPPERIRFVYLKEGEVRSFEPTDDNWRFMINHARHLQRDRRQGEFEADPGGKCYWCDYEYYCPASGAGMGDIEWEDFRT